MKASSTGSQAGLCIAMNWEAPATTGGLGPCDYDLIGLGYSLDPPVVLICMCLGTTGLVESIVAIAVIMITVNIKIVVYFNIS